jgi:hypothetical protein
VYKIFEPKLVLITIESSTSVIAEPAFETNEHLSKMALTLLPSGAKGGLEAAIVKFVNPALRG